MYISKSNRRPLSPCGAGMLKENEDNLCSFEYLGMVDSVISRVALYYQSLAFAHWNPRPIE